MTADDKLSAAVKRVIATSSLLAVTPHFQTTQGGVRCNGCGHVLFKVTALAAEPARGVISLKCTAHLPGGGTCKHYNMIDLERMVPESL